MYVRVAVANKKDAHTVSGEEKSFLKRNGGIVPARNLEEPELPENGLKGGERN